ncbi:MAG: tryptophan--tRNA ligase [Proteobacteria bacterium]|nr:tryptophan--tRNA ligase [Pseudomonadota bacterium]
MKKRIFSGMQPTGQLHLGNYLGALRNWVKLQKDYECFYGVMDLHAITLPQDPKTLARNTRETAAAFYAAGIDPSQCAVYPQSAVLEHTYLQWLLANHTPLGWLNRMTQFKEKSAGIHKSFIKNIKPISDLSGEEKERINQKIQELEPFMKIVVDGGSIIDVEANLGLFAYPVLMAADILIYKATHVPVGEDQKQHLELSRDVAGAFNRHYGVEYFPIPEPQILGEAARVMSLRDGTKKMSKSDESDYSRINLTDDADAIKKKFQKAKTDPLPCPSAVEEFKQRPEIENLFTIYAALADKSAKDVVAEFSGKQLSAFKNALADLAIARLEPITKRMRELMQDEAEIDRLINKSLERARALAAKHLAEVKDIIGLWRG